MRDPVDCFIEACRAVNKTAETLGFPPFTTALRTETPLNSAPYLFDMESFRIKFGFTEHRLNIIDHCEAVLGRLAVQGVIWKALLVGGSFIRPASNPSDLDAMVVYTIAPDRAQSAEAALRSLSSVMRDRPVDLSFCPADADPIILVKRVIFFSTLFSYDRQREALVHGTVMITPEKANVGYFATATSAERRPCLK